MKVNGLATKGKVMDNPFGGKAVTAYCAGLAVCLFHKVTLIQPEVYLGNALLDIYHIKIICEYLWKDTTQQLLGLHDAKITNTYEIMCLRGRGCNWVLRLTRFDGYQHLVVMLFGILKHFDSLRELEIGMKAEAHKLGHLGMSYLVRRSTLAEANIRRPQEFFASVYAYLLEKYAKFLADSRPSKCYKGQTHEPKDWEKLLYMMDSTTITLFDNILKGVGRHPKSGKKKGGMKVHTVMKYHVGVPMVVQLTSAAKHDHYLLKEVHLPKDSTLAMDRGYVDVAQFQRLTEEGVCYVTKMKKNLKYEVLESVTYVNAEGLVTHIDQKVLFTRGELTHEARRVEIFYETKRPVVLLTNNFDFTVEDIAEIYRLRWAIESLYKQLKQNFPLHFFYGDSVNAIQIQTWVVLIANLLITVLSRSIKRHCAFSQVVTMIRLMLMYYVDFIAFMENPEKTWNDFLAKEMQKAPPEPSLFD